MLAAKLQKSSEMYKFYELNTRAGTACPRGSPRDQFRYDLFITFKDATLTEELWSHQAEKYKTAFPGDNYNKWAAVKKSVIKLIGLWVQLDKENRDEMSQSVHSANGSSFAMPCFGVQAKVELPPTQTLQDLLGKRSRGRPPKSNKSATIPNKRVKMNEEEVKDDLTDLSYVSDWESKVPNKTGEAPATMAAFKKQMSSKSATIAPQFNPRKLAAPISEKKAAKQEQKANAFDKKEFDRLEDKAFKQGLEIRSLKWNVEELQEKLRAEIHKTQFLNDKVFELEQEHQQQTNIVRSWMLSTRSFGPNTLLLARHHETLGCLQEGLNSINSQLMGTITHQLGMGQKLESLKKEQSLLRRSSRQSQNLTNKALKKIKSDLCVVAEQKPWALTL